MFPLPVVLSSITHTKKNSLYRRENLFLNALIVLAIIGATSEKQSKTIWNKKTTFKQPVQAIKLTNIGHDLNNIRGEYTIHM